MNLDEIRKRAAELEHARETAADEATARAAADALHALCDALEDTTRCPVGVRCEVDGTERQDLIVATFATPMGFMCLTTCPDHAMPDMAPPVCWSTAARLVEQHAAHVGLTIDEMNEVLGGRGEAAEQLAGGLEDAAAEV